MISEFSAEFFNIALSALYWGGERAGFIIIGFMGFMGFASRLNYAQNDGCGEREGERRNRKQFSG